MNNNNNNTNYYCYYYITTLATKLVLLLMLTTNILKRINAQQQDWPLAQTESCEQLKIVKRQEWGAKRSLERLDSFESSSSSTGGRDGIPNRVFIHQAWDGRSCADIDSCSIRLQAIQAYHQHSKGWPDISYNFLISADGIIYEGVGFTQVGFHTLDYNYDSLGIAFIGTFQDIYPSGQMEKALGDLLDCAVDLSYLSRDYMLHGHKDARCTICPGRAAYERISQMSHYRPGPLARYSCPRQSSSRNQQQSGLDDLVSPMMMMTTMMRNNDSNKQQVPITAQVLNINSNNHVIAAPTSSSSSSSSTAMTSGSTSGRPTLSSSPHPFVQEDTTFVGVFKRKRFPAGVNTHREPHSIRKSSLQEIKPDQDVHVDIDVVDGRGTLAEMMMKAPINIGPKEKIILVQPQQISDANQQQQQPALYLLRTKTVSNTSPILLISSPPISTQSSSSVGTNNKNNSSSNSNSDSKSNSSSSNNNNNINDRNNSFTNSSTPNTTINNSTVNSNRRGEGGSYDYLRGNSTTTTTTNNNGSSRNSTQRQPSSQGYYSKEVGLNCNCSGGGSVSQNIREPTNHGNVEIDKSYGVPSSGRGYESQAQVKFDTEPLSLWLGKLFDFDFISNITSRIY